MGRMRAIWLVVLSMSVGCADSTRRAEHDAGRDAHVAEAGTDAARDASEGGIDAALDAGFDANDPSDAALDGNDDQVIRPNRIYAASVCPLRLLRANLPLRRGYHYECVRSADCMAQANGVCFGDERNGELYDAYCRYLGCATDSECASNEACECGWGWSGFRRCVSAECHADTDCAPGQQCLSWPECYRDVVGISCTTDADDCHTNEDCQAMGTGDICIDNGTKRVCAPASCPE